jgi:hypothetical protein
MLTLHLNLAQSQVLSQALVQYLDEGAVEHPWWFRWCRVRYNLGQGVEGGNVTLAERLLEQVSAYIADPDQPAAERAAEKVDQACEEMMHKAIERMIEYQARVKQERRALVDEAIAERQEQANREQEIMRKVREHAIAAAEERRKGGSE